MENEKVVLQLGDIPFVEEDCVSTEQWNARNGGNLHEEGIDNKNNFACFQGGGGVQIIASFDISLVGIWQYRKKNSD